MPTLLTFGHGYSAAALTRRLVPEGWRVIGTTREEAGCSRVAEAGAEPLVWPGGDIAPALAEATHLLISAGPDEAGDPVLNPLGPQIAEKAPELAWAGYLSTTGVYGDHGGDWVTEETPLRPATRRGEMRVAAEEAWATVPGLSPHIFRLAGIYGPGRGPFAKLRSGKARRIVKPGQVFSRIHVEDIAQVLVASLARPNPGRAYNVCDDDPAPPQEVIAYAADLLGMAPPPEEPLETADLSPMARSFYAESKRVSNARIKEELGVSLLYSDYHSGLKQVLQDEASAEP